LDLRQKAVCDSHVRLFPKVDDASANNSTQNFFSEIISTITDIKFSHDGKYIAARDYMTIKYWDIANEKGPVRVVRIHDNIEPKLCDLYENDMIFDKFESAFFHDDNKIITGSYHNIVKIYDIKNNTTSSSSSGSSRGGPSGGINGSGSNSGGGSSNGEYCFFADRYQVGAATTGGKGSKRKGSIFSKIPGFHSKDKDSTPKKDERPPFLPPKPHEIDFNKKVLHVAAHPKEPFVAVASGGMLYMYS